MSDDSNRAIKACDDTQDQIAKMLKGMELAAQEDWDVCVLSCDDIYIQGNNLRRYLEGKDLNCCYGNIINHWPDDPNLYYMSGAGQIIPRAPFLNIVDNLYKGYSWCQWTDVYIGQNCQALGIPLVSTAPLQHAEDLITDPENFISCHHLSNARMVEIDANQPA